MIYKVQPRGAKAQNKKQAKACKSPNQVIPTMTNESDIVSGILSDNDSGVRVFGISSDLVSPIQSGVLACLLIFFPFHSDMDIVVSSGAH